MKRHAQRRDLTLMVLMALTIRLVAANFVQRPGYMDTAYYTSGAIWTAQGGGLTQPFIWNYLNDPVGIPHPGFLYWMPLPSFLAAPAAALFPESYFALQVPFAILAALLPLVAYSLTRRATGRRELAWGAGLLIIFSGFFFPYWTLPETFSPYALVGSLALWLAGISNPARRKGSIRVTHWLSVGLLVGLAHLTRADGVLLLPIVALAPSISRRMASTETRGKNPDALGMARSKADALRVSVTNLSMVIVGYGLVMGPWFARNLVVLGTPLSAAGTKTIWLTEYDDLFCFDCDLSPSSYLAWGLGNIVHSKLAALWTNFQRFLAEDCLVFLFPFAVIGFYRLRRHLPFLLASLYLIVIYLAHSLVFTFPGWRGGFFHASSAVLPFLYAAGLDGLDAATRWVAKQRTAWRYHQARSVFTTAAVIGAMMFSSTIAWRKIPEWRGANALYEEVDRWLTSHDASGARVMVGNPPAFWYHTERLTAIVPNEDVETLLRVADRYEMHYVLLEEDHPAQLANLHAGAVRHPRLRPVKTWSDQDSVLYAVHP